MSSQSWQVRIDSLAPDNGWERAGSGFLVTERHVVTCAHVVAGAKRVEVVLAQHPDRGPLGASVVRGECWDETVSRYGDVAVLELDEKVPVTPARIASISAEPPSSEVRLTAYGFPEGFDEGILGEFRTTSRQLIAGEWIQLEAWTGHSQPLAEGFSGGAVVREDTGEVVGMITAKYPDGGAGRMIPARLLTRYWPGATELTSVSDRPGHLLARLDGILQRCTNDPGLEDCDLQKEYRRVAGGLAPDPPGGVFHSLWDVAWFLLTEVDTKVSPAPWSDLAARVADLVGDPTVRNDLLNWAAESRPAPAAPPVQSTPPRPEGGSHWSPILIEIDRSGADSNLYNVSISAVRDGHAQVVAQETVPGRRVREFVEERLDSAFHLIGRGSDELIVFALPTDWLGEPVDQWQAEPDDPTPLGCSSPVVVVDLNRRRRQRLQHKLHQAWQAFDSRTGTAWHRVECLSPQDPVKLSVRLGELKTAVGYGAPPNCEQSRKLLHAGLKAAVPVLVWPRTGCASGTGNDTGPGHLCEGGRFLDAVEKELSAVSAADLPHHVRKLRSNAFSDDPQARWATGLTLLWEDPRCLPEAPIPPQSPVS
ncbi:trypsin-like peptidase domain-containing protein [Kitasatospora sp. NPDC001540]|uniref:VMAP-C domain-containing protein n=1 Tax=Kitasatospora sp. NPDC001540 TaxID=3364014 RepID=UPI0036CAE977